VARRQDTTRNANPHWFNRKKGVNKKYGPGGAGASAAVDGKIENRRTVVPAASTAKGWEGRRRTRIAAATAQFLRVGKKGGKRIDVKHPLARSFGMRRRAALCRRAKNSGHRMSWPPLSARRSAGPGRRVDAASKARSRGGRRPSRSKCEQPE